MRAPDATNKHRGRYALNLDRAASLSLHTARVGSADITLRLMAPADREAFLAFMRAQPEDDLFFLLVDVTTPEGLEHWMHDLEQRRNLTVLAEENGKVLGYCSLHHGLTRWTRHPGEFRLRVAPDRRGRGAGRLLGHEVFSMARELACNESWCASLPNRRALAVCLPAWAFTWKHCSPIGSSTGAAAPKIWC